MSNDTLKEIEAGIERHHAALSAKRWCEECKSDWPCETLKTLQGWKDALVRAEAAEALIAESKDVTILLRAEDRARAVEAKKRDFARKVASVALGRPHDGSQLDEDLEGLLLEVQKILSGSEALALAAREGE